MFFFKTISKILSPLLSLSFLVFKLLFAINDYLKFIKCSKICFLTFRNWSAKKFLVSLKVHCLYFTSCSVIILSIKSSFSKKAKDYYNKNSNNIIKKKL